MLVKTLGICRFSEYARNLQKGEQQGKLLEICSQIPVQSYRPRYDAKKISCLNTIGTGTHYSSVLESRQYETLVFFALIRIRITNYSYKYK
jgi:hypothetical protein